MKLKNDIIIHNVAGEKIAMLHEKDEMTRVVSFNDSSFYLWNSLKDKEFDLNDVTKLLLEKYEVDEETAKSDSSNWIKMLDENGLLS